MSSAFSVIPFDLLKCGSMLPFNLYVEQDGKYVLRHRAGEIVGRKELGNIRLQRGKTACNADETALLSGYIEERLGYHLLNPAIGPGRKAGILYASAVNTMSDAVGRVSTIDIARIGRLATDLTLFTLGNDVSPSDVFGAMKFDYSLPKHLVNSTLVGLMLLKHLKIRGLCEFAIGALCHDIGMLHVDPGIKNKHARLTPEEKTVIQRHPVLGVNAILRNGSLPPISLRIILEHHEKLDGSGYPSGLTETDISEHARVFAIADIFSALTEEHPYRSKMETFPALREMNETFAGKIDFGFFRQFIEMLKD